jgi:hypothetical protein
MSDALANAMDAALKCAELAGMYPLGLAQSVVGCNRGTHDAETELLKLRRTTEYMAAHAETAEPLYLAVRDDLVHAALMLGAAPIMVGSRQVGSHHEQAILVCGMMARAGDLWNETVTQTPEQALRAVSEQWGELAPLDWKTAETRIRNEWTMALRVAPATEWSVERPPNEWARVFECDVKSLGRWVDAGKVRAKVITKRRWRICLKDLPSTYDDRQKRY